MEEQELTPDMFLEEIAAHRGIMGIHEDVELNDEEWQRFLKYLTFFTGSTRLVTLQDKLIKRGEAYDNIDMSKLNTYQLLAMKVTIMQNLHEHSQNVFRRKVKFLSEMKQVAFVLFPALNLDFKIDAKKNGPSWTWFSGTEEDFHTIIKNYTQKIQEHIIKTQNLEDTDETINFFVENLPLVDQVLKYFPDYKSEVCLEHQRLETWKKLQRKVSVGLDIAAIGATYGLGAGGIVVGSGIYALGLGIDYMQYKHAKNVLANVRMHELASWSQTSVETQIQNSFLAENLESSYNQEFGNFAISVATGALLLPGAVKQSKYILRAPKVLRQSVSTYSNYLNCHPAKELSDIGASFQRGFFQRLC